MALRVWLLPNGAGWTTRAPGTGGRGWTYADLACGIGGFTVAAHAAGGTRVWACDSDPGVVAAFNVAHPALGGNAPAVTAPLEERRGWGPLAGVDVLTAGFPCQAFSRAGAQRGFLDPRGTVIFGILEMASVVRPRCLVLECVWAFFENEEWLGPTVEGFQGLGYGVVVRKEDAMDVLPQKRERGFLIAVGAPDWGKALGPLGTLFTSPVGKREATMASMRVVGPDPPPGDPLYLTPRQEALYSPTFYRQGSWPSPDYIRLPGPGDQAPTVMRSYGDSLRWFGSRGGAQGFFRRVPGRGIRLFSPREIAVIQGFPFGLRLPDNFVTAWQDRKSTRLNSSHSQQSRMPSSA